MKLFVFFILMFPCGALAQFDITGRVLNHTDTKPIQNVSVFLNNATIGGRTSENGVFILHSVKPGKYDLVVSIVGYETYVQAITINNSNLNLPDITIVAKTIALDEVKIRPKDDPDWQKNFGLFKDVFFGRNDMAKDCRILNPELLDLSYNERTGVLTGKSVDFLVIENKALGYHIKYLLSGFKLNKTNQTFLYTGAVLFEKSKGSPSREGLWKQRRLDVYNGSKRNFLQAALDNKLEQEGFRVLRIPINPERPPDSLINRKIEMYSVLGEKKQYRDSLSYWKKKATLPKLLAKAVPYFLTSADIISPKNQLGLFALGCSDDALYISYSKDRHFSSGSIDHSSNLTEGFNTVITFMSPWAFFDSNGSISNPESLSFSGSWANSGIAGLLPLDYEPGQNVEVAADSVFLNKIKHDLGSYLAGYGAEKVHLQYDKPYYAAGDTVYFKAYVVIGPHHELSTLSGSLIVELIDPENKISGSIKLKLNDGTAWGDFALPDTLNNGNYRIRAYTNWMRNAGQEYFFDNYITVVNSYPESVMQAITDPVAANGISVPAITKSRPQNKKFNVQFFPEGGRLVNGLLTKVAFKAIDQNGLGAGIKGIITDEQGRTVTAFASQHLGMGVFTLMPEPGKKYKAAVSYADGAADVVRLPEADSEGYVLTIDNSSYRNISVNIQAGKGDNQREANLVAQSGGIIYYFAKCKLVNKSFTTIVPKSRFPTGIVQCTLFSLAGEPLNERLVFIQNNDQLDLKLHIENTKYALRDKVKVTFNARSGDDKPVSGNFSIAVIDETKVPVTEDDEGDIFSNLLLTSDLKGYVEKPNYYFDSKNDKANADLDVLMLTQGYHRFEWQQIISDEYPAAIFQPEKSASVSGRIDDQHGKPISYGKVSLLSVSKNYFFLDTVADEAGRFLFKNLPSMSGMRYAIQATNEKMKRNTKIELNGVQPPSIAGNKNAPDNFIKQDHNLLAFYQVSEKFHKGQIDRRFNKNVVTLKEVKVKDRNTTPSRLKHSSNLNGQGAANDVLTADRFPAGCPVFMECIASHLHGIQFKGGIPYYEGFRVLVLIDGIEINVSKADVTTVADILNSLSVDDISSVEFLTDGSLAAAYGVKAGGAVILVTTKKGDEDVVKNPTIPVFAYFSPVGYYKARVFYSPNYDIPKIAGRNADLRTTIYWNPNVVTDKDGNASVEFFNADGYGTYRIVIEGVDDNGTLGREVFTYNAGR